jgi:hypothetical protein
VTRTDYEFDSRAEGPVVPDSSAYATRTELKALESTVEKQISSLAKSVEGLAEAVSDDRERLREEIRQQGSEWRDELRREREANRFPAAAVIGILALVITMVGMAGTLVVFAINGATAPLARDVKENVDELEIHWNLTFPRLRWEGMMEERVRKLRSEMGLHVSRLDSLHDAEGERLENIERSRFTQTEGTSLLRRLELLEEVIRQGPTE